MQEQENNIAVDPVWTDPTADDKITVPATPNGGTGTGGGGTGGGGNGGGSTPAPTETVTLMMPQTAAAVSLLPLRESDRRVRRSHQGKGLLSGYAGPYGLGTVSGARCQRLLFPHLHR